MAAFIATTKTMFISALIIAVIFLAFIQANRVGNDRMNDHANEQVQP